MNADYLADRGAAIRLNDDHLAEKLLPTVLTLLRDPQRLAAMGAAATALDRPHAAEKLAELLLALGWRRAPGQSTSVNRLLRAAESAPDKEEARD